MELLVLAFVAAGLLYICYRLRHTQSERERLGASRRGKSFIYAWQSQEYVKIGRAKDWKQRIRTFQTAQPKPIRVVCVVRVKNAVKAEEYLHMKFEDRHVKMGGGKEWFRADRDLLLCLRGISDK